MDAPTTSASSRRQGRRTDKQLACLSCKRKKIKVSYSKLEAGPETNARMQCQQDPGGSSSCRHCAKIKKECYVPEFDERRKTHTKELIEQLRAENSRLKQELEKHRDVCFMGESLSNEPDIGISPTENEESPNLHSPTAPSPSGATDSSASSRSDNMIVRLCGGHRQLNSDRIGRLRFFGPTSSLHLMESITSSILTRESLGTHCTSWQDDFPPEIESYLLDLYWKFHHTVLPW